MLMAATPAGGKGKIRGVNGSPPEYINNFVT